MNKVWDEAYSSCKGLNSWPYRMKLTTDHLRWDSVKMSNPNEFEERILKNMSERRYRELDEMIPIEIYLYDVDICETYKVKLVKKDAFWFEPLALDGEKSKKDHKSTYNSSKERERKEFVYSIEPFRHIVKRRNLDYEQEIGLRWSGSETIDRFDFSVLSSPRFTLFQLMNLRN